MHYTVSAHRPASPQGRRVARRDVLVGLPLFGAVTVIPASAQAEDGDTPVLQAYREWRCEFARMEEASKDLTDGEYNRALCQVNEIADRLCGLPARTPTDVLVKLVAITYDGDSVALDGDPRSASVIAEAVRFTNAELM